jgi:hypothetical protein
MSEVAAAKAELALTLQEADLDVYSYIPARVTPPVIVIRAASPYMTTSSVGAEYLVNLELQVIAGTADNESSSDDLDDLIEACLLALPQYSGFKDVSAPYTLVANGNDYLAATIGLDLQITL